MLASLLHYLTMISFTKLLIPVLRAVAKFTFYLRLCIDPIASYQPGYLWFLALFMFRFHMP